MRYGTTCLFTRNTLPLLAHGTRLFTPGTHLSTHSARLFTRCTLLPIRPSTRSTCLSTRSIFLFTCTTRLAIRCSTRSTRRTIYPSFFN